MLNLDFTPEQDLLRDTVRSLCDRFAPLDRVRELEDDPDGIARELWDKLAELGLCGLMAPESCGGAGMSLIDGVVMYEELGRALAPVPHFASCVLSAGAIAASQPDDLAHADIDSWHWAGLLGEIASGRAVVVPAWLAPGGGFKPAGVRLTATPTRGDDGGEGGVFRLDGVKLHVGFAAAADHLLVLARTGEGETEIDLLAVAAAAAGRRMEPRLALASDAQYLVDFDGVRVPSDARIGPPGGGWAIWEQAMTAGAVLAAAQAVGGADATLEMTVDYAKTRRQFGKALAEFQSISHYLADAKTSLDAARILVHEAAWAHSVGGDTARLAPMAKLFACRVYREVTAMAQQVYGGIGFTVECDAQLYFRRAKQLQLSWWDPAACEDRIAAAVLGPA